MTMSVCVVNAVREDSEDQRGVINVIESPVGVERSFSSCVKVFATSLRGSMSFARLQVFPHAGHACDFQGIVVLPFPSNFG